MNPNPKPWSASQPEPDKFCTRSTTIIQQCQLLGDDEENEIDIDSGKFTLL